MPKLETVLSSVIEGLEIVDHEREAVIHLTRQLNRLSGRGIARLVKGFEYTKQLEDARKVVKKIDEKMDLLAPITSWNLSISGTEEYAEFELLHALITNTDLPTPEDINIPSYIWISGLCDTIGEIRRIMLNALIEDDIQRAKLLLEEISKIYSNIAGLEFSKSLVPNLRRKTDIARTLIERSESDFVNALVNKRT